MTTQATHTPGPWTATHDATSKAAVYRIEGSNHHVASIRGDKAASHFRAWEANARLIAAAPDLLAALRNMLCEVRMSADTENRLARLTIEHAEKAIAKAEGRAGE